MSNRSFDALLIHGAGGGGWEWRLWRHVLEARGHRVHTPDLHAAAGGIAATVYADYARQVRRAVERLARPRVLVGASLGGLLALDAADAADALVLVNPLPPAPWHAQLPARSWPDVVPWGANARLSSTRRALADADEATAIEAMRHWRDESGAVLRAAHAGLHRPRPTVPTLCFVSQADDDVPPALTRAMADAWEIELLASASTTHVGPLLGAAAAQTARQASDWLQRQLSTGLRTDPARARASGGSDTEIAQRT